MHGHAVSRLPEIAESIAGFAPGIVGYGLFLYFTRGCYAQRDAWTPTLVNAVVTVVGVALMFPLADAVAGRHLVTVLGVSYAVANTIGAVALWVVLHRTVGTHHGIAHGTVGALVRNIVAASVAGVVVWIAVHELGPRGVMESIAQVVVGTAVGLALFLVVQMVLGGPAPVLAVRSLGSAGRGSGPTGDHGDRTAGPVDGRDQGARGRAHPPAPRPGRRRARGRAARRDGRVGSHRRCRRGAGSALADGLVAGATLAGSGARRRDPRARVEGGVGGDRGAAASTGRAHHAQRRARARRRRLPPARRARAVPHPASRPRASRRARRSPRCTTA